MRQHKQINNNIIKKTENALEVAVYLTRQNDVGQSFAKKENYKTGLVYNTVHLSYEKYVL